VYLLPLHAGPHDSPDDLTAGDWVIVLVALAALIGLGYGIWVLARRRRYQ
jgi:hypothetical protein